MNEGTVRVVISIIIIIIISLNFISISNSIRPRRKDKIREKWTKNTHVII